MKPEESCPWFGSTSNTAATTRIFWWKCLRILDCIFWIAYYGMHIMNCILWNAYYGLHIMDCILWNAYCGMHMEHLLQNLPLSKRWFQSSGEHSSEASGNLRAQSLLVACSELDLCFLRKHCHVKKLSLLPVVSRQSKEALLLPVSVMIWFLKIITFIVYP